MKIKIPKAVAEKQNNPENLPPLPEVPKVVKYSSKKPSPPLFIKIDRYKGIVKDIHHLKSYVLSLRDALDVMEELEKQITNGLNMAQKALDELNLSLSSLDALFLKHQVMEEIEKEFEHKKEETKAKDVPTEKDLEDYVKGVYEELEKLKSQLKTIPVAQEEI